MTECAFKLSLYKKEFERVIRIIKQSKLSATPSSPTCRRSPSCGLPAGGAPLRLRRADALQPRHRESSCGNIEVAHRGRARSTPRRTGRSSARRRSSRAPPRRSSRWPTRRRRTSERLEVALPLPDHRQHRQAAQDAQDRRDGRGHGEALYLGRFHKRALPGRSRGSVQALTEEARGIKLLTRPDAARVHDGGHVRPDRAGGGLAAQNDRRGHRAAHAAHRRAAAALPGAADHARVQLAAAHRQPRAVRQRPPAAAAAAAAADPFGDAGVDLDGGGGGNWGDDDILDLGDGPGGGATWAATATTRSRGRRGGRRRLGGRRARPERRARRLPAVSRAPAAPTWRPTRGRRRCRCGRATRSWWPTTWPARHRLLPRRSAPSSSPSRAPRSACSARMPSTPPLLAALAQPHDARLCLTLRRARRAAQGGLQGGRDGKFAEALEIFKYILAAILAHRGRPARADERPQGARHRRRDYVIALRLELRGRRATRRGRPSSPRTSAHEPQAGAPAPRAQAGDDRRVQGEPQDHRVELRAADARAQPRSPTGRRRRGGDAALRPSPTRTPSR